MDKIALLNEDTFEQSLGDILNLNSRADKHTILLVDDEVNNLQLLRAGEPLGGKASAESDFATDADDDFLA